jgi:PhoPQ-activated pathogenicity-related protein
LPQFSWTAEKNGTLRVTTQTRPTSVKLWQATNPNARDFRMETLGPRYESTELADSGGGVYVAKVPAPAKGWTAFFVELTYPSGCQAPFKFTTQVCVVPDVLPYKFVSQGPPR